MSDLAFNIWGVVGGVVFALVPALIMWIRARLPSRNLPYLLELLREAQELFGIALREGLLTDPKEIQMLKLNIWHATVQVDEIRAEAYSASTWTADVGNWWNGLSGSIFTLSHELNTTRILLARVTSCGRKLRASQELVADLPRMSDEKASAPACHAGGKHLIVSALGHLRVDPSAFLIAPPQPPALTALSALPSCPTIPAAVHGITRTEADPEADGDSSGGGSPHTPSGSPPSHEGTRHQSHDVDVGLRPACAPITATRPMSQTISDADLRGLLSLALFHPPQPGDAKHERAARRAVLLRFGQHLCGQNGAVICGASDMADLEQYSGQGDRRETLWRLSGMPPPADGAVDDPFADPERLVPAPRAAGGPGDPDRV